MGDNMSPEKLTLQPNKDRDSGLGFRRVENKTGWRIKAASAIAATAAAFGIGMKAEVPQKVGSVGEGAVNVVRQLPENLRDASAPPVNEIQKKAYLELKSKESAGNQADFVKDLTVGKDGANVRNMPRVTGDDITDQEAGNRVLNKLEPGTRIPKAMKFRGSDPSRKSEAGVWYVIPLPGEKVGFVWSGNFAKK